MDKSLRGSFSFSSFLDQINLNDRAKEVILSYSFSHDDAAMSERSDTFLFFLS